MPLNDNNFAARLEKIFKTMWDTAENNPRDVAKWYSKELAKAINDEIRNGDVQSGIRLYAGTYPGQTIDIGKIL